MNKTRIRTSGITPDSELTPKQLKKRIDNRRYRENKKRKKLGRSIPLSAIPPPMEVKRKYKRKTEEESPTTDKAIVAGLILLLLKILE